MTASSNIQGRNVSRNFLHTYRETTLNLHTKEWRSVVSGNFSWDTRTFNITSVGTPSHAIYGNFGAAFSQRTTNVTRQGTNSGRTARFTVRYNQVMTLGVGHLGGDLNFGTHQDSFTTGANALN